MPSMHLALVERALCLREHTTAGTLLISPSYYRRERKESTGHPAVLVSYRFHGLLDDIYATLVVRLHHSQTIEQDELWRYAADFKTLTGKQLGVKLTRLGDGAQMSERLAHLRFGVVSSRRYETVRVIRRHELDRLSRCDDPVVLL